MFNQLGFTFFGAALNEATILFTNFDVLIHCMEQPAIRYTFGKTEKLCNQKLIEKLFDEGTSFFIRPIKVLFLKTDSKMPVPVQLLITVPKKYLRHATDRNRLKRLFRESYRKQKQILFDYLNDEDEGCLIAFIYTGRDLIEYSQMEGIILRALQQLIQMDKKTVHNTDEA